MIETVIASTDSNVLATALEQLLFVKAIVLVVLGFSIVIFVHELGHFMAAKWCDVRVDKFAIGFGRAILSWRKGLGFRWGNNVEEYRQRLRERVERNRKDVFRDSGDPTDAELAAAAKAEGLGETEYCFNVLPLGGYVKMLGQEDFEIDKSGELAVKADPRAFTHKPIGQRMIIVSAGVLMNIVFAAFVFMIVFMLGRPTPSAEVGYVLPASPADRAGLRPGDVVVEINGHKINDREDLVMTVVLSDPHSPLSVVYDRKVPSTGKVKRESTQIRPTVLEGNDASLKIGVAPALTTHIDAMRPDPSLPADRQVQAGDEVIAVEGKPVSSFWMLNAMVADRMGKPTQVTVRRPSGKGDSSSKEVNVEMRAWLQLYPTGKGEDEDNNLLGFVPRRFYADEPADTREGDLRYGDVIVKWDDVVAPRLRDIRESVKNKSGKDVPVTVLRDGKEIEVKARFADKPRAWDQIFQVDNGATVVCYIVSQVTDDLKTAAAVLKNGSQTQPAATHPAGQVGTQPAKTAVAATRPAGRFLPGSRITRLNDKPVQDWLEIARQFTELAGTDVKITWELKGVEQSGFIHVPQTVETALRLPSSYFVTSVDGISQKEVERNGRLEVDSIQLWAGEREILKDYVGKTVLVGYESVGGPGEGSGQALIKPEMLDTWTRRVGFGLPFSNIRPGLQMVTVVERNPVKAMGLGIMKTYGFIVQVYDTMRRMLLDRSVSMDQVSGPVGIIQLGTAMAQQGTVHLLYWLAIMSANLAVINFLPMPIVDGGLFVFLLIEKIKGKPISLKVQVATQIIGLALIISLFLFVTFQDVRKWLG